MKKVLVVYNGHTIYQVYIKDQKKVIWVKNLWIFEDYKVKVLTKLSNYNKDKPMF